MPVGGVRQLFTFSSVPLRMSGRWAHRLRLVLPHLGLLLATLVYALAGALVFIAIERPYEIANRERHLNNIRQIQLSLLNIDEDSGNGTVETLIDDLIFTSFVAYDSGIRLTDFEENVTLKWNVPSAIFFTTTVLTSIGYGHLVPISPLGRLLCIGYAFLGIPLTLVTIADIAKFLADGAGSAYHGPLKGGDVSTRGRLCIVGLLLLYMTIAALVFSSFERAWSFLDSFYFCLITLVTVGFGDLVPVGGERYVAASIVFIFVGLILTTLTVDVIGSSCIAKIHAWGRGWDALSLLLRSNHNNNQCWFAYVPQDVHNIPFIDSTHEYSENNNNIHAASHDENKDNYYLII